MEKGIAPIPAFYACYLLRSIARHASLYIGSTPSPPRRLRQHNGESKGGAVRTSKDSLRPWEMTCLVTGFPSKISALQFEWAWQNPQLTRHIAPDSRITEAKMTSRISPKTGKVRKRAKRPRLSLTDRLRNLHLLLRARSFQRWPLQLTFYCEDVHRVWLRLVEQTTETLPAGLQVTKDESCRKPKSAQHDSAADQFTGPSGIQALDVSYSRLKLHLQKSQDLLQNGSVELNCCVCRGQVPSNGAATLVCSADGCPAVSHLQCLSIRFMPRSHADAGDIVVRSNGKCPACSAELRWVDLVKELSLRMRGEREVRAMFKPKKGKKGAAATAATVESDSSDAEDELPHMMSEDSWPEIDESSDDDVASVHKHNIPASKDYQSDPTRRHPGRLQQQNQGSEPVVEDSEWDDAELLT